MTSVNPSTVSEGLRLLHFAYLKGHRLLGATSDLLPSAQPLLSNQKIVIEYSSPNIAKPFHIGHLRSTLIGQVLANCCELKGHKVTRLNWLGDWGGQFGILATALEEKGGDIKGLNVNDLYNVYVEANARAERDEAFAARCKVTNEGLENHDANLLQKWRQIREISLAEFSQLYDRFHINFDSVDAESDYADSGKRLVAEWLAQKKLDVHDGHVGLRIDDMKLRKLNSDLHDEKFVKHLPRFVTLGRPDGSAVYLARDLAALIDRYSRYRFDSILYVVGAEQTAHMRLIKLMIDLVGQMPELAAKLVHVSFRKVTGMSTRKGTAVFVDELLRKGEIQAEALLRTLAYAKINEENREKIVREFATGSWIVKNFSFPRTEAYQFLWERALRQTVSNKRPTLMRLQYCHARLCSLLKKAQNAGFHVAEGDADVSTLLNQDINCVNSVIALIRLSSALDKILASYDPHDFIPDLFAAVDAINVALKRSKVISETNRDFANAKLTMFAIAKQLIEESCSLLCIEPLEEI